jgi:hypothetical protein
MMGSRRRGWRRRVALCGDDRHAKREDVLFGLHGMHLVLAGCFVSGVSTGCIYVFAEYPIVSKDF